jgi:hypothetical protein
MKSSKKRGHQILGVMPEKRACAFLLDCVNLQRGPENRDAEFLRLSTRYPDIVPHPVLYTHELEVASAFRFLAFLLQQGWDGATQREREWFFQDAESFSRHLTAKDVDKGLWGTSHESPKSPDYVYGVTYHFIKPPAQPSPLEAVFHYLWQHMEHALHCANPECPAPYFFATKKNQKYCSPECAEPARRASKLRWWNDNRAGTHKTPKQSSGSKRKAKGESRAKAKEA